MQININCGAVGCFIIWGPQTAFGVLGTSLERRDVNRDCLVERSLFSPVWAVFVRVQVLCPEAPSASKLPYSLGRDTFGPLFGSWSVAHLVEAL